MSGDLPFGFSPDPDDPKNPGQGGFDMSQLGAMLQQLGAMLQSGQNQVAGPVDWELAKNLARQAISQKGDPSVNDNDVRRVNEAFDLAQLWLDAATTFPAGSATPACGAAASGSSTLGRRGSRSSNRSRPACSRP